MRITAIFCSLAVVVFGQLPPNVSQPTNIDFREGAIGQMPPGWEMPPMVLDAGYRTELRQEGCGRFSVCVAYIAPEVIGKVRNANLTQTFPAGPYIGKSIRFSAWLRLDQGSNGGYIHIRMRIDYADRHVDMRDSIAPPVDEPRRVQREVFGHVNPGAVSISIWARYVPSGFAWVASPTFGIVDDDKVPTPPAFGVATGTFPVKDASGKMVRFGAWIKTENVTKGYAGLWWRVEAERERVLSFDNSSARMVDGKPASGDGTVRGATGTSDWTWHEIELPVAADAHDIAFGFLLDGNGKAWFDTAEIELNGEPHFNPQFDFDFESATIKGFPFAGDSSKSGRYKVAIDKTTSFTGLQSLQMQFIEPEGATRKEEPGVKTLEPGRWMTLRAPQIIQRARRSHSSIAAAGQWTSIGSTIRGIARSNARISLRAQVGGPARFSHIHGLWSPPVRAGRRSTTLDYGWRLLKLPPRQAGKRLSRIYTNALAFRRNQWYLRQIGPDEGNLTWPTQKHIS